MEDRIDDGDLPVSGAREPSGCTPSFPASESVPSHAPREFPGLEVPSGQDLAVIERQLGRPPQGKIFVACRCPHGRPRVILTLPFESGGGPVPPLLWLSCPHVAREAGRMESAGTMRRFQEALAAGGERVGESRRFIEEEERFGEVQAMLAAAYGPGLAGRLEKRGIAGGHRGAVKCLHAHLAYRLARGQGIIGGWCLDELDNGSGSFCEKIPQTCLT